MKIAYIDCFSGISGDMFMGALLDAGLSFEELKDALNTMPLGGYHLEARREERNHITGTRFMVKLDKDQHAHRGLDDIKRIIQAGSWSQTVREKSIRIFESIARVEGNIHNLPPEEVHFHEVGAVDSIIDIVGTVFGVECLNIQSIHASALPIGPASLQWRAHPGLTQSEEIQPDDPLLVFYQARAVNECIEEE